MKAWRYAYGAPVDEGCVDAVGWAAMASTTAAGSATAMAGGSVSGGLLKMDARGRVRTSRERRQAILAEFDRIDGNCSPIYRSIRWPTPWKRSGATRCGGKSRPSTRSSNPVAWLGGPSCAPGSGRLGSSSNMSRNRLLAAHRRAEFRTADF